MCGCDNNLMNREQRKSHRYPFIADAEAVLGSVVRPARVELLSLAGAYLVMAEPFSKGTSIFVKIRAKTGVFECKATVAHSTHGTGMGVMFNDISPEFRAVLQEWLLKATDIFHRSSQPQ